MNVYLIYNRETPGERLISDYAKRLEAATTAYELIDADSPRGIGLVEALDVTGRPAIVVTRDDGSAVQMWQIAESFPPPQEISHLARG